MFSVSDRMRVVRGFPQENVEILFLNLYLVKRKTLIFKNENHEQTAFHKSRQLLPKQFPERNMLWV